jgi:hypothetical protein
MTLKNKILNNITTLGLWVFLDVLQKNSIPGKN